MAHEIETHGDQAAVVVAREDAWHRLGTTLPDAFTAEEAMEFAHLGGWNVRKVPLIAREVTEDGVTEVEVPDKFGVVRDSPWEPGQVDALGVVGPGYTPIQNEDHAALLNALVDESGAHFETAGSLRGGREVFLSIKFPDSMLVGGVDAVDKYIVALNGHNGESAFKFLITDVRVLCANTQAAALANNIGSFTIRHTSGAYAALDAARSALDMTFKWNDEFNVEAERMIQTSMTQTEFRALIEAEYREPDASDKVKANETAFLDELEALFVNSPYMAAIRDTRWAAYQTFTEYADFFADVRAGDRDEQLVRAEKAVSAGGWETFKQDAFDLFRVPELVPAKVRRTRKASA